MFLIGASLRIVVSQEFRLLTSYESNFALKFAWVSAFKKLLGAASVATLFGIFGYFSLALIVPYFDGRVDHQEAVVRSMETSKERYGRRPSSIRCVEYINLVIDDYGNKSLCFRLGQSGSRALSLESLRPAQQVVLQVRTNVFGKYVESISPAR